MADKTTLSRPIAAPSITGLRSVWQWRPLASLTPASVADILRRAAMGDAHDFLIAADDIREKDLHYRAVLQVRTMSVAGLPVSIQPWDDSRKAKRAAQLVEEAFARIDLSELIGQLMDAVAKGYSVAEVLWDTREDVWLPAEIVPRPAHWFQFDQETGTKLRLVDGSPDGAEIPPYKMILHRPPITSGIPLHGGVARSALWAWVFKSYALRDWARFCEIFGQPIRVGKYHLGATQDDVAVLKRAVFDLGSDAAAVIPEEMQLELIESNAKSASADLYLRLIEYLDKQVSKAVLGQTMTTDSGQTGSLAQARVHEEVRREILQADARAIVATLTRDLITPIVRLNMGTDAPLPTLTLEVGSPDETTQLAETLVKLTQAGLAVPQWWVHERFGIPAPVYGDVVIGGAPQPQQGDDTKKAMQSRTRQSDADDPTPIDPMVDQMARETEPEWVAIMDRIKAIVDRAESLEALRDGLLHAFADLPTDRLAEVMAMGFAAAELAGRYDVKQESSDGR